MTDSEILNIDGKLAELTDAAAAASSGRAAQRMLGGRDARMSSTLLALTEGNSLAEHENPGEAFLLVLRGRVRLNWADGSRDGGAGDLLVVPPQRHSLAAVTDAAVLLTAVRLDR